MSSSTADDGNASGRRIAEARRAQGLTQADLAARIGVSLRAMDRYETGIVDPTAEVLELVAEITGVSMSSLTAPSSVHASGDDASEVGMQMARSKRSRPEAVREVPETADVRSVPSEAREPAPEPAAPEPASEPAPEHAQLVERISDAVGEFSSPPAQEPGVRTDDEVELRPVREHDAREGGAMSETRPAQAGTAAQPSQATLPAPPLDIRHEDLPRKTLGYSPKATAQLFDQVADAYMRLWQDRAVLKRRVEELNAELLGRPEGQPEDPSAKAKLQQADANQRGLSHQLQQSAAALAQSREEAAELADRVGRLETELGSAREAVEAATDRATSADAEVERYREQERMIGELLVWARQASTDMAEEAKRDADSIRRDAKREAEELLSTNEREVERLATERKRLEALASEVHEDLSAFLVGALERVNGRTDAPPSEPTEQADPGASVAETSEDAISSAARP